MNIHEIVKRCLDIYHDLDLNYVRQWKETHHGAPAIGYLPIYVPREIIHAAGMLPVGIMGGGDMVEIIKGDAFYQSYICHIPRSIIELGLSGKLDCLDGMLCPSICDVIRNLSGMWQVMFPDKYVKYLDFPQNFNPSVGGEFYRKELLSLKEDLEKLRSGEITGEALRSSIDIYNKNRHLMNTLYDLRAEKPWLVPTYEAYLLARAGNILSVEEHNKILTDYLAGVRSLERREMDNARVVLVGAFCEQPPLGLIRTLENAGCYIVDDDFVLGHRWLLQDVDTKGNPISALAQAFIEHSTYSSAKFEAGWPKGELLVQTVERRRADGVIFACPSFCDPALLDRPEFIKALDTVGIPHTNFQYTENIGQFQVIREQTGTFSDSIKLWSIK
jgi:benzoyl-CoA reductase subunit C